MRNTSNHLLIHFVISFTHLFADLFCNFVHEFIIRFLYNLYPTRFVRESREKDPSEDKSRRFNRFWCNFVFVIILSHYWKNPSFWCDFWGTLRNSLLKYRFRFFSITSQVNTQSSTRIRQILEICRQRGHLFSILSRNVLCIVTQLHNSNHIRITNTTINKPTKYNYKINDPSDQKQRSVIAFIFMRKKWNFV